MSSFGLTTRRAVLSMLLLGGVVAVLVGVPGIGALGRAWFALTCHRMPERSFALEGMTFPVCARCTGIYGGLLAGTVLPLPRWLTVPRIRVLSLGGLCLLLAGVLVEHHAQLDFSNAGRFAVGLAAALPFGARLSAMLERKREGSGS